MKPNPAGSWLAGVIVASIVFFFIGLPIISMVMLSMTRDSVGNGAIVLAVASALLAGCSWLAYRINQAGK